MGLFYLKLFATTAIITSIFVSPATADQFTNPSNDETDLAETYAIDQTILVTWTSSLDYLTLAVAHWDVNSGSTIGVLLCESTFRTRFLVFILLSYRLSYRWTDGSLASDQPNKPTVGATTGLSAATPASTMPRSPRALTSSLELQILEIAATG